MTKRLKNPAAVALGSMGGRRRSVTLSAERRSEIATEGARKRWKKPKEDTVTEITAPDGITVEFIGKLLTAMNFREPIAPNAIYQALNWSARRILTLEERLNTIKTIVEQ